MFPIALAVSAALAKDRNAAALPGLRALTQLKTIHELKETYFSDGVIYFRAVTVISILERPINLATPAIVRVGRGSGK